MSELLAEYTPDRFPYSEILGELTEEVRADGLSPFEAYDRFTIERDSRHLSPYFDYASTSITTGGHALYMDNIGSIIEANTRTAREMVTLLDKQQTIVGQRVVLPVDMGKTGWSQSEFMEYWSLTIAGPNAKELKTGFGGTPSGFERYLGRYIRDWGVEVDVMNDSSVNREERRPEYEKFVQAYATAIGSLNVRCLPAYRMISLVDPDISLGCWAEKQLANRLDIPVQRVAPVKWASISEAVSFEPLHKDLSVIMAAGGTVCVAPRGSILTLVGEAEPLV